MHENVHKLIFASSYCDSRIGFSLPALAFITIPENGCILTQDAKNMHILNEIVSYNNELISQTIFGGAILISLAILMVGERKT